jgi:hypothetical protein
VQDQRVFVLPLSPAEGIAALLSSIPLLAGLPSLAPQAIQSCTRLTQERAVSALHFCKNPDFWRAIT